MEVTGILNAGKERIRIRLKSLKMNISRILTGLENSSGILLRTWVLEKAKSINGNGIRRREMAVTCHQKRIYEESCVYTPSPINEGH
jgi:hypothetical protein